MPPREGGADTIYVTFYFWAAAARPPLRGLPSFLLLLFVVFLAFFVAVLASLAVRVADRVQEGVGGPLLLALLLARPLPVLLRLLRRPN